MGTKQAQMTKMHQEEGLFQRDWAPHYCLGSRRKHQGGGMGGEGGGRGERECVCVCITWHSHGSRDVPPTPAGKALWASTDLGGPYPASSSHTHLPWGCGEETRKGLQNPTEPDILLIQDPFLCTYVASPLSPQSGDHLAFLDSPR